MSLEFLDYYRESEITCPYCLNKEEDSWETEDSGEYTCSRCEKEFYVEIETEIKYTSSKIE